jgi:FdhE protein
VRPGRTDPRDIAELKLLKQSHPELSTAVDMQVALVELQRRIQSRLTTPLLTLEGPATEAKLRSGRRLVDFPDIPLDWSEFRLAFRQTVDILRRFEALEQTDHDALQAVVRDGSKVEPLTRSYYERTAGPADGGAESVASGVSPMLDQVLALSLRPFLARCSDVCGRRLDLGEWRRPWCPVCGGEPDFAVLSASAERCLICGRCLGQWPFHATACPFCGHDEEGAVTSFASRDRRYRVYGCSQCRKYLKAYDTRGATRPVMPAVDTIATLPLDAAAIQKGYDG